MSKPWPLYSKKETIQAAKIVDIVVKVYHWDPELAWSRPIPPDSKHTLVRLSELSEQQVSEYRPCVRNVRAPRHWFVSAAMDHVLGKNRDTKKELPGEVLLELEGDLGACSVSFVVASFLNCCVDDYLIKKPHGVFEVVDQIAMEKQYQLAEPKKYFYNDIAKDDSVAVAEAKH